MLKENLEILCTVKKKNQKKNSRKPYSQGANHFLKYKNLLHKH